MAAKQRQLAKFHTGKLWPDMLFHQEEDHTELCCYHQYFILEKDSENPI